MYSTETNYISVDEYITRYGRDNVIEGFNKAEVLNEAMLSGNKVDVSATNITVADLTEPNDLFLGF